MRSEDRKTTAVFRAFSMHSTTQTDQTRLECGKIPTSQVSVPVKANFDEKKRTEDSDVFPRRVDGSWKAKWDAELGLLAHIHAGQSAGTRNSTRVASRIRMLGFAGLLGLVVLAQCSWLGLISYHGVVGAQWVQNSGEDSLCPQVSAITPSSHGSLLESLDSEFATEEFKLKAYESLGGAVRIPTETFDDLGTPEEDPRWEVHYDFHTYVETRFPRVHENLSRTKVNTYALVYHWKGSDETLKPVLIAAHADVVPVEPATADEWINPPYSGYYDGEWIWGRGSCDDKSGLIGSLTAIETLLERGFAPTRSIILAFGIDEERGGYTGALSIGEYLLETFGEDSISLIVDEGGGYSDISGTIFASPAVAEKGYLDVRVDVSTPGGHSSKPPKHTGIGILSNIITELEAHPHQPQLVRDRTYYQSLQCRAEYDNGLNPSMRKLIQQSRSSDKALHQLEEELLQFDPAYYAQAGTTQAIDLIGGGVKVNALPEAVWTIANHRIADYSSVAALQERFASIVNPIAAKYNMSLDAFGELIESGAPAYGQVRLSQAFGSSLEPAPVSPTTGSGPYELLSGTIISTLQTHLRTTEPQRPAVVSPGLSLGNTDTRHYWKLTKHIFRYGHRGTADNYNGAHTTNEAIRAEGFLEVIRFYTRFILNADETNLLD